MAAYDMLLNIIEEFFINMGYNPVFVHDYISTKYFKEIACIRLANANVMIKNKTDHSSHQTHIAITGEMIGFFCDDDVFTNMDNTSVSYWPVCVSKNNISYLNNTITDVIDPYSIEMSYGNVSWGKRTQNQIQLSKKNSLNSACFNQLRLGLYEDDLLIMLKFREEKRIFAIGIPQVFYLDVMPNFYNKYETNTYLRLPIRNTGRQQ